MEAIQAVLARQGITFATPQVDVEPRAPSPEEEEPTEPSTICRLCDESPAHERPLCPVIKGGVRAMRKRVGQLEKDTSGDATKQAERQEVIAELQAIIQKRSRKPKTLNVANGASTEAEKAAVNGEPLPAATLPIVAPTKTAKQVDVVSPHMPVVDVVTPIASSQPVKATSSIAKPLKPVQQPSPSQPPQHSRSQQSSSSRKSVAEKTMAEKLMTNLSLVVDPDSLGDLRLSKVTDSDLLDIIHGPRFSIADMSSSEEDQEEEEEEEEEVLVVADDELEPKTPKRFSQGSTRLEYPSSSDAGDEDDNSEGGLKRNAASLSAEEEEEEVQIESRQGDVSSLGEDDTSPREVAESDSPREIDKTGDDTVEAVPEEDSAILKPVVHINGRPKMTEADSDTAVGSQNEEPIIGLRSKKKKLEVTAAGVNADPIEPSEPPDAESAERIVSSDDRLSAQPTPKGESMIRTRSQRRRDTEQQEDSNVQVPKNVRKTRKVTELPIPFPARLIKSSSLATGAQRNKAGLQQEKVPGGGDEDDRPSRPSVNGKVGSIKDTKNSVNTRSKVGTSETVKGLTQPALRTPVVNASESKPKPRLKIKPMKPIDLVDAINKASAGNKEVDGISVLQVQESPVTEMTAEADELLPEFSSPALLAKQSQNAGPSEESLFIPSETQQSFPYSQFPEIFATPKQRTSHESDDENEVLASVVKTKPQQPTYRGLSQIAGSQKFAMASFQATTAQERAKEPESLYGRNHVGVSDTESDSESSEDTPVPPVSSHIPVERLAGVL